MSEHTPTPWRVGDYVLQTIFAVNGTYPNTVAVCQGRDPRADAEFIVRACNAHAGLVEALKKIDYALDLDNFQGDMDEVDEAYKIANNALAKANE